MEVGGRFKREGAYVYLCLIHVNLWQKSVQYCKAIILQLKIKRLKTKIKMKFYRHERGKWEEALVD